MEWKEYWPFLRDFADLRCMEGLEKLEDFLRKQFEENSTSYSALVKNFKNLFEPVSHHFPNFNYLFDLIFHLWILINMDNYCLG